jgi:hypothetical protein
MDERTDKLYTPILLYAEHKKNSIFGTNFFSPATIIAERDIGIAFPVMLIMSSFRD